MFPRLRGGGEPRRAAGGPAGTLRPHREGPARPPRALARERDLARRCDRGPQERVSVRALLGPGAAIVLALLGSCRAQTPAPAMPAVAGPEASAGTEPDEHQRTVRALARDAIAISN